MKTNPVPRTRAFLLRILTLAAIACLAPAAHSSTFWNGSSISFTQGVDGTSDVLVSGAVALDRGVNEVLFNSVTETGVGTVSPADTTWAVGSPSMIGNLSAATIPPPSSFIPLTTVRAQHANFNFAGYLLNGNGTGGPITFVVHLVHEDIYLTLTFTSWGRFFSGGFAYTRSTPSAVAPPPTPTISITSPANGAVFAAPANVKFTVNASVSTGSVTNVSFFNGGSSLGSSQASPFNFTTSSLGAGSYAVTAVATAAGISATSSVVNVSVVTPVITSLSSPTAAANNQLSFSYNANSGLRYVVERSSNLVDWTPLFTNTASASSVLFTTNILSDDAFYRVGRLPNP